MIRHIDRPRPSRNDIVAFVNHRMEEPVRNIRVGAKGWAHYPSWFFGEWKPGNNKARRSMMRPKRVTFVPIIGWVFDIELRMIATRNDICPVGTVFMHCCTDSSLPASCISGAVGYLATRPTKRIKVIRG